MKVILILSLCLISCTSPAQVASSDDLAVDRERFKQAYQALTQGRRSLASKLISGLESYPLYPYFRHFELKRRLTKVAKADIREFLAANDRSYLASVLRRDWLKYLGRTRQWSDFLEDYRPQSNTKLQCSELAARIKTGDLEGVIERTRALWLVGKSQPNECDAAFDYLDDSEIMNDQLVWQRIRLSLQNRKPSLARYLSHRLTNNQLRTSAGHWIDAHTAPLATLKKDFFKTDNPRVREIVLHAIKRLAARDVDQAITVWAAQSKRFQFSDDDLGRIKRSLAIAAASQNHAERIALLDQVPPVNVDDKVEKYRIRESIETNAWEHLARWTKHDPVGSTGIFRWRYWRARALQSLEKKSAANIIFRELAKQRDYYGFLSADQLQLEYQMNDRPIMPSEAEIADILTRPSIIRARELIGLDMRFKARREWAHEIKHLSDRQLEVAAFVANGWGWHDRAIFALGKAQSYDDLTIRFPLLYKDLVARYAVKRGLPAADIYSIIRTESAFIADARSAAGALGLMQLMPATGRDTARRIGASLSSARDLLIPAKNVMLGSAYLKQVLNRFSGSFSLAAAAYNAGPHRVKTWLPKSGCVPADIWIDTIPFTETRRYVRRAAFYATVYQWRLNEKLKSLADRLTDVVPKGGNRKC